MRHPATVASIPLIQAKVLPLPVEEKLGEWAEDLVQITFGLIATKLEGRGYPVSGDFTPGEVSYLESAFEAFIRSMAMNNNDIGKLNQDA